MTDKPPVGHGARLDCSRKDNIVLGQVMEELESVAIPVAGHAVLQVVARKPDSDGISHQEDAQLGAGLHWLARGPSTILQRGSGRRL